MTTSVTFSCLGALVAFLLLACVRGDSEHDGSWARSWPFARTTLVPSSGNDSVENTTNNICVKFLQTPTTSGTSGDSNRINVTISENDARTLRQEMEAVNDQLASNICRLSISCGGNNLTANVTKVKLNEEDIPSYFYDVKCPSVCKGNGVGLWFLDEVAVETIFYKKLGNDTHEDQYEVRRRSQTVSCSLTNKPVIISPTELVTNPTRR